MILISVYFIDACISARDRVGEACRGVLSCEGGGGGYGSVKFGNMICVGVSCVSVLNFFDQYRGP